MALSKKVTFFLLFTLALLCGAGASRVEELGTEVEQQVSTPNSQSDPELRQVTRKLPQVPKRFSKRHLGLGAVALAAVGALAAIYFKKATEERAKAEEAAAKLVPTESKSVMFQVAVGLLAAGLAWRILTSFLVPPQDLPRLDAAHPAEDLDVILS